MSRNRDISILPCFYYETGDKTKERQTFAAANGHTTTYMCVYIYIYIYICIQGVALKIDPLSL